MLAAAWLAAACLAEHPPERASPDAADGGGEPAASPTRGLSADGAGRSASAGAGSSGGGPASGGQRADQAATDADAAPAASATPELGAAAAGGEDSAGSGGGGARRRPDAGAGSGADGAAAAGGDADDDAGSEPPSCVSQGCLCATVCERGVALGCELDAPLATCLAFCDEPTEPGCEAEALAVQACKASRQDASYFCDPDFLAFVVDGCVTQELSYQHCRIS